MEKRENPDINIVLVGLDYNFTLEVGKLLSEQLDMYFLDTQGLYEFDIRPKTIEDMVEAFGWEYYRNAQCGTVKYVCSFTSTIMAVESGAVMNSANLEKLNKYGLIIYLHQPQQTLVQQYQNYSNLSDIKKQLYCLTEQEIKSRDEQLQVISEIIVNDFNAEPLRCCFSIVKEIKKFYGVE